MKDLEVLSAEELTMIKDASLEILESVGLVVDEPTLFSRFVKAGATSDNPSRRIRIPTHLVEWALSVVPKSVTLCGRSPEYDIAFGTGFENKPYFRAGSGCTHIYDPMEGGHRLATILDVTKSALIIDGLTNTNCLTTPVLPSDVPIQIQAQWTCAEILRNTEKHVTCVAYGRESASDIIEIASIVAGGLNRLIKRPLISCVINPLSPLILDSKQSENLVEFSGKRLPITFGSAAMAGSTSPVTLAGTLVVANAETLAGLVASQIMVEGAPFLSSSAATCMDLRTAAYAGGAIERALLGAAHVQITHSYGLPAYGGSALSDSKVTDEQTGYEKAQAMLITGLSGADLVAGGGVIDSYFTLSYEQLIIDDELAAMLRRALRGIKITPETLAIEAIQRAGPGGNFLHDSHTLRHMREEIFVPTLTNLQGREKWYQTGSKDVTQVAREKVAFILANHKPKPIAGDLELELEAYLTHLRKLGER